MWFFVWHPTRNRGPGMEEKASLRSDWWAEIMEGKWSGRAEGQRCSSVARESCVCSQEFPRHWPPQWCSVTSSSSSPQAPYCPPPFQSKLFIESDFTFFLGGKEDGDIFPESIVWRVQHLYCVSCHVRELRSEEMVLVETPLHVPNFWVDFAMFLLGLATSTLTLWLDP